MEIVTWPIDELQEWWRNRRNRNRVVPTTTGQPSTTPTPNTTATTTAAGTGNGTGTSDSTHTNATSVVPNPLQPFYDLGREQPGKLPESLPTPGPSSNSQPTPSTEPKRKDSAVSTSSTLSSYPFSNRSSNSIVTGETPIVLGVRNVKKTPPPPPRLKTLPQETNPSEVMSPNEVSAEFLSPRSGSSAKQSSSTSATPPSGSPSAKPSSSTDAGAAQKQTLHATLQLLNTELSQRSGPSVQQLSSTSSSSSAASSSSTEDSVKQKQLNETLQLLGTLRERNEPTKKLFSTLKLAQINTHDATTIEYLLASISPPNDETKQLTRNLIDKINTLMKPIGQDGIVHPADTDDMHEATQFIKDNRGKFDKIIQIILYLKLEEYGDSEGWARGDTKKELANGLINLNRPNTLISDVPQTTSSNTDAPHANTTTKPK